MKEIDAGAMLERAARAREPLPSLERDGNATADVTEARTIDGARGAAELAAARRPWPVGGRTFLVATGLVVLAVVGVLLAKARHVREENERRREVPKQGERVEKRVPALKLAAPVVVPPSAPAVPAPVPAVPPIPESEPEKKAPPSEAELLRARRLSRGFGTLPGEDPGAGAGREAPPAPAPGPAVETHSPSRSSTGGLDEKLEAVEMKAASAGVLPDRDYLLTQGAMLDCVLETKLVSSVAGMTSCHLTRDIYSTNGRVVLLDRGSRVVGRYQGGMQQGNPRIFVVWTRVETPEGVVVNLESPGTGALGEAGLEGFVDTHFWDRFGAAILMSIVEDGSSSAAARLAGATQNSSLTITSTPMAGKDVVSKSLDPTLNIPPTLTKNQGERIGILVARDLDFRSVYGLAFVAEAER